MNTNFVKTTHPHRTWHWAETLFGAIEPSIAMEFTCDSFLGKIAVGETVMIKEFSKSQWDALRVKDKFACVETTTTGRVIVGVVTGLTEPVVDHSWGLPRTLKPAAATIVILEWGQSIPAGFNYPQESDVVDALREAKWYWSPTWGGFFNDAYIGIRLTYNSVAMHEWTVSTSSYQTPFSRHPLDPAFYIELEGMIDSLNNSMRKHYQKSV